MTIAYWCVLVAGLLPLCATAIAKWKFKGDDGRNFNNHNPREWLARQGGFRARANAAQLNSFEAFPFFAAGVIIAHLTQAPQGTLNALAVAFVVARIAFIALYVANLASLRTVVCVVGYGITISLFLIGK
jgi:uncharacterized MAPEG superfamily protein